MPTCCHVAWVPTAEMPRLRHGTGVTGGGRVVLWAETQAAGVRGPGLNLWVSCVDLNTPGNFSSLSLLSCKMNIIVAVRVEWVMHTSRALGTDASQQEELLCAQIQYTSVTAGSPGMSGEGHTQSQTHRAVIHLEKRKPTATQTLPSLEVALGDPHQTAHSFYLELKSLQAFPGL